MRVVPAIVYGANPIFWESGGYKWPAHNGLAAVAHVISDRNGLIRGKLRRTTVDHKTDGIPRSTQIIIPTL